MNKEDIIEKILSRSSNINRNDVLNKLKENEIIALWNYMNDLERIDPFYEWTTDGHYIYPVTLNPTLNLLFEQRVFAYGLDFWDDF